MATPLNHPPVIISMADAKAYQRELLATVPVLIKAKAPAEVIERAEGLHDRLQKAMDRAVASTLEPAPTRV